VLKDLKISHQNYACIQYMELHTNRLLHSESTDIISFVPTSKVCHHCISVHKTRNHSMYLSKDSFFLHGATAPSCLGSDHCRGFAIILSRLLWTSEKARCRDLYKTTHKRHPCPRWDSNPQFQQPATSDRRLRQRGHWYQQM